jgi:hypothetical protein
MRLMQVVDGGDDRRVVARDGHESWYLADVRSIYELARRAEARGSSLEAEARDAGRAAPADPRALLEAGRVLAPIDHPDPAHLMVSGTGLTHLGSAASRDAMHQQAGADPDEHVTDSMRMFRLGIRGGKPAPGRRGVQPEWFYKGDGDFLTGPEATLFSPRFADDGGEEPEVAGVYLIGDEGVPLRLGFALCNEFSDHVMERQNYLWLAHSKLRPCALGPELLLGDLPDSVEGVSRIRREGEVIFEKPFLTGEANMSHSIANLEAHHFKYAGFRRPGDVHVHTFGTATLSFADGIRPLPGDIFEIESAVFGLPLRNTLAVGDGGFVEVKRL